MRKVLKPYTIIPPYLYIQRDADRQVKNIIDDMGRPGYVLVSRQMGKTNLLLNAKRNLQTELDAFVYIDLSNIFDSAKDCFENIINIAIETNPEKFSKISETIYERRKILKDTSPHRQHNNELRNLLQSLNGGKLVIILDEIDALTKTSYSDQIFSQIRSCYFAGRVNYEEFFNLTYLLSGVVEPSEIIKDQKISPFNIGQKIFLNDFSKEEFEEFIIKSELVLSNDVKGRIFYWTDGNPRTTWDLCSELENLNHETALSEEDVDKVVSKLYLTTFNKPPIDNIREIVKKERDIRNAIIEIEFGKANEISDEVKNKLYLAGIINYSEHSVVIKNEIIRRSLSYEWLKLLEENDKDLLSVAIENYKSGQFAKAVESFQEFLKVDSFPIANSDSYYLYMGHAYYLEGDFKRAIESYDQSKFDLDESPKSHFGLMNLKGLAYKDIKEYEQSKITFEYVINYSKKDENFLRASISLGQLYMNNFLGENRDKSIEIFSGIIDNKHEISPKVKIEELNDFKSVAYYNYADILFTRGDHYKARELINKAIPIASNLIKLPLLVLLVEVTDDISTKTKLLLEIVNLMSLTKVEKIEKSPDQQLDISRVQLLDILLKLYENNQNAFTNVLTEYSSLLDNKPSYLVKYNIASLSIKKNKWDIAIIILNEIYLLSKDKSNKIDSLVYYNVLKLLSYTNNYDKSLELPIEYLSLFEINRFESISLVDFIIISNTIYYLIEKENFNDALKYISLIDGVKEEVDDELLNNYLAIRHLELNLYYYKRRPDVYFTKARELLNILDSYVPVDQSNLLGDDGIDIIRNNVTLILNSKGNSQKPVRAVVTFNRNEKVKVRYKDGTVVEAKYKRLEDDIKAGKCYILQ